MKRFETFVSKASEYMRARNLAERWELLTTEQKKDAYGLKIAFGWSISICIQQVLFFGNTVEKENRLCGRC